MIKRDLSEIILKRLNSNKAIIIKGARQVGKTSLLKALFENKDDVMWLNADEIDVRSLFETVSSTKLKAIIGNKKFLIIDESQRIKDIGLKLKLIADEIPQVQIIATGSSSFELSQNVNEPLTGRKLEYQLFPFSFKEMCKEHGLIEEKRMLSHRLVYGYYPDIVVNQGNEIELIKLLADSYLYKDISQFDRINKHDKIVKLLQALAFQVGSQVSFNELGQICALDSKTVEKYIIILEQAFIIFRLPSFSRNLRNELKSSRKIYFYDNGIRNAVIANFSDITSRLDAGALFENFIISERMKHNAYSAKAPHTYFWRTKTQQEIDYIEEWNGHLTAFEIKWNDKAKAKEPKIFKEKYANSSFEVITPNNMEDFLCSD